MTTTVLGVADVLLVEDDPGDVMLTRDSFEDCHLGLNLHVASDGEEALSFLHRAGEFAGVPRPALILLDLNLPRKSGREVLAEIKGDAILRRIPVVVLTTSQSEEDVMTVYNLNANCYVTKPADLDDYLKTIRCLEEFWLRVARLPTE